MYVLFILFLIVLIALCICITNTLQKEHSKNIETLRKKANKPLTKDYNPIYCNRRTDFRTYTNGRFKH